MTRPSAHRHPVTADLFSGTAGGWAVKTMDRRRMARQMREMRP